MAKFPVAAVGVEVSPTIAKLARDFGPRADRALRAAHEQMATDVQRYAYEALVAALVPEREPARYNDNLGLRGALKDPGLHASNEAGWSLGNAAVLRSKTRKRENATKSNPYQYWRAIDLGSHPKEMFGILLDQHGLATFNPRRPVEESKTRHEEETASVADQLQGRGAIKPGKENLRYKQGRSAINYYSSIHRMKQTAGTGGNFVRQGMPFRAWRAIAPFSAAASFHSLPKRAKGGFWFRPRPSKPTNFVRSARSRLTYRGARYWYSPAFAAEGIDFLGEFKTITGRTNRIAKQANLEPDFGGRYRSLGRPAPITFDGTNFIEEAPTRPVKRYSSSPATSNADVFRKRNSEVRAGRSGDQAIRLLNGWGWGDL